MSTIPVCLAAEQLRRRVPGGIGTYTLGLLQGLRAIPEDERPRVTIHVSRPPARPDPLARLGFPVVSSPFPGPILTRAWDLGLVRLGRGAAVLHAVSLAAPAPHAGTPLVVTVHDLAWRLMPDAYPASGRRWHEAALRRAARRAAVVVVPSEATAGAVRDAGVGIGDDRVVVVPEGADHLPSPDDAAAGELLDRLGVAGSFLLSVSTLEPRKNLERLVRAYALARPRLTEDWPLLVVGPDGWSSASRGGGIASRGGGIASRGARIASTEGVVLAGAAGAGVLAALYRRARCCAYVPLVEGFGLPVVEAMAQGTPVVSSPVPSSGGASLEVDPLDVSSIADGLVAASCDEATRAALVARGGAHAAELTWVRAARTHAEIWDRVAAGWPARR